IGRRSAGCPDCSFRNLAGLINRWRCSSSAATMRLQTTQFWKASLPCLRSRRATCGAYCRLSGHCLATRLQPGACMFHRWMDVRASDVDEFIALAGQAWSAGGLAAGGFDVRAFGLFRERTDQPVQRMLLLTYYGSHADWEGSRVASPSRSQREWEAAGRPAA